MKKGKKDALKDPLLVQSPKIRALQGGENKIYGSGGIKKKLDFFEEILSIEYQKGHRRSVTGNLIFWACALFTAGISLLVFHWFDKAAFRLRHKRCALSEASKVHIKGIDGKREFCRVTVLDTVQPPLKMLIYRHTRYFYDDETKIFERMRFNDVRPLSEIRETLEKGMNPEIRRRLAQMYGPNVIDFPVPSIPKLLIGEVLHPFFIFQIYSVILWGFENYYYYAAAILFIAVVSIVLTLRETRSNLLNLRKIARFECPVSILREGTFQQVSSTELIPGDIIEITHGLTMPCDVALLQGQAVLNESMLTGESIPVIKVPIGTEGDPDDTISIGSDTRTVVYGGTQVLKLQPSTPGSKILGMVLKCGFETTKGALILSILYPKPSHFKFFNESLKFLGILCAIGLCGFGVTVYRLISVKESLSTVFIRALDLITIVVPPALPMAMTVGTGFALMRLKKKNIYCISPPRINMAGKIEIFCFDKTGTLTEEGLDLLGLLPATSGRFDDFTTDLAHLPKPFLHTMATCHTLTTVNNELIGDPLELKIFQATLSTIHDGQHAGYSATVHLPHRDDYMTNQNTEIGLLDRFEFQSQLQRMSVLVRDLAAPTTDCTVFVKGSPEMIHSLSIPDSVPRDFAQRLDHYTNKGYRVLACGYKIYDGPLKGIKKETLRKTIESELLFLGFIIMENKLKRETPKTLDELKGARIRCIMVTGDNVLTAVSVARECGLIPSTSRVFMGDTAVPVVGNDIIKFVDVTSEEGNKLKLNPNLTIQTDGKDYGDYALAITGKVWETLFEEFSKGQRARFMKLLEKGAVFARMTPDQKAALVEELQNLGFYVAMCGDGANDCSALKAAHVGISLSEAEASIAAPFTSTRPNITCTPVLIREGRASLAVSFKLFQFMGMYSMIQFMSVIFLYFRSSVLGNWQYLYQDLIVVFPLVIFMGKTKPCAQLAIKRPSGRLVSGAVVGSLLTHVAVCGLFQATIYFLLHHQHWYTPDSQHKPDPENIWIYDMTTLFLFANFQYLIMALVYSWGRPFLNSMYTNYILFGIYLAQIVASLFLLLVPLKPVYNFGQLLKMPLHWRLTMLGMVGANFLVCMIIEWAVYFVKHRTRQPKHKAIFDVPEEGVVSYGATTNEAII